jgi:hypothetical protein
MHGFRFTRYFELEVLRTRPYLIDIDHASRLDLGEVALSALPLVSGNAT